MKFFIILLLVFTLYADDYEKHDEHHINKELSHLNLSKKQNKKILKLLKHFRVDLKSYRKLYDSIEEERKEIFLKDNLDINKLNKLNYKLDKKAHDIENDFLYKIHKILDEKQRVKFIHYFDDWEVR